MNFEFKLIEKIESLDFKIATPKEICLQLGMMKKFEMAEVAAVLDKMVAEGRLEASGKNKYSKIIGRQRLKGVLRGNKRGFAFLIRDDGGDDIFIPAKSLGGAMHADTVMVQIVKGDEGKVTSILERGIKRLVGEYHKTNKSFGFVIPDSSSYYKDIYISAAQSMSAATNTKVVVEITGYGENPEGRITEIIGRACDKQSTVLSILKSYGFFNEFDKKAEDEAKAKELNINYADRTDYRELLTITIDGEDSKDLDDAISLEVKDGKYTLYVHIADVSHFVTEGSILDEEAFKRCTSVYFPGNVYPMLPQVLSNGLCSLNEGIDRLTLTCSMTYDNKGNLLDSLISKSVINNDYRMTYTDVTAIINRDKTVSDKYVKINELINNMSKLAEILKAKRDARGNINFETKECKIVLDEFGNVADIEPYPYTVANGIIEEFMIAANETVAEFACKKELPFVYRVHEKPDPTKMEGFNDLIKSQGYRLPAIADVAPKDLQQLLLAIAGQPLEQVISKVMLRCMKKAKYYPECLGHFGLASEYYCHFTSPIRRYPDLQIHRVIKGILDNNLGSIPKLAKWCKEVADTSSEREKASETAEREIDDFYKAEYMAKHIGEEFDGIISGVTSFGIFIEISNTCEGLARLDNLPKDNYTFIEARYKMQGTQHEYNLGQKVRIKVIEADAVGRKVSFDIID